MAQQQTIIAAIITALGAQFTNVQEWNDTPVSDTETLPRVMVRDPLSEVGNEMFSGSTTTNKLDHLLTVEIQAVGTLAAASASTARTWLGTILSVIGANNTWSGNAIDTNRLQHTIDIDHEESRTVSATLTIQIHHRTNKWEL